MKSVDILNAEHGLIDRVLEIMRSEKNHIVSSGKTDIITIEQGLDFFVTYWRLTHRAKEDRILFPLLRKKRLSEDETRLIEGLMEDHTEIDALIDGLASARDAYIRHEAGTTEIIRLKLDELTGLLHLHFKKERERLFPLIDGGLTDQEEREMVERFHQLNGERIHSMIEVIVDKLEWHQVENRP